MMTFSVMGCGGPQGVSNSSPVARRAPGRGVVAMTGGDDGRGEGSGEDGMEESGGGESVVEGKGGGSAGD